MYDGHKKGVIIMMTIEDPLRSADTCLGVGVGVGGDRGSSHVDQRLGFGLVFAPPKSGRGLKYLAHNGRTKYGGGRPPIPVSIPIRKGGPPLEAPASN